MPAAELFGVVQCEDQQGNLCTEIKIRRGWGVGSGNTVVVGMVYSNTGETGNVTDDQGNTYTKRQDVTRGARHQVWTCTNVTNAPKTIFLQVTSGSGSGYLSGWWGEICGVGNYNTGGTNSNAGSTTPNCGSISPGAGDLIVLSCNQDGTATFITSWTPNTGYTAMCAELMKTFLYAQWRLHTSGATTPGCTLNSSRAWTGVGATFTVNTANGTAPVSPGTGNANDVRIQSITHNSFDIAGSGTPFKIQGPCVGASRIIILAEDSPGVDITSITDTIGNTYTLEAEKDNSAGGKNEAWSAPVSAGTSTNIITINFSGSDAGCFITFIALKNDGGIDDAVTTTLANLDSTHTSIVGASTTPSTVNGLLITLFGVESSTVTAVSPGEFISCTSSPTIGSPAPLMQNNGYAIQFPTSLSAVQRTWTLDAPPDNYQEINIFVKSAASGATAFPMPHYRRRRVIAAA